MYIVTGAAGFVGSNIVRALNDQGLETILAVDDLTEGDRFRNLADCKISDYMDRDEFRQGLRKGLPGVSPTAIFHQGACADTTESDGRYMLDNNFTFSKELLHWALERKSPLVYASSASVYGNAVRCVESPDCERPLNVYAYSKLLFDQYVRRLLPSAESTVVGLRYFNVYGPRESHKGRMASMVYQLYRQLRDEGVARLFQGTDGFADGEQRRDFVCVEDVVNINLFFAESGLHQGIYNVGTGRARSFNDIARILIERLGLGQIQYIPFPDSLQGKYQSFTESDINALRGAGYHRPLLTLEDGIARLLETADDDSPRSSEGSEAVTTTRIKSVA